MLTLGDMQLILDQVSIGDLNLILCTDGERPYLQVVCERGVDTKTGEPTKWTSRKWMLSKWLTKTELVRTAYKAYMGALKHEAQEVFKYKGAPIYSPHLNVEILSDLWEKDTYVDCSGDYLPIEDSRASGMSGV